MLGRLCVLCSWENLFSCSFSLLENLVPVTAEPETQGMMYRRKGDAGRGRRAGELGGGDAHRPPSDALYKRPD